MQPPPSPTLPPTNGAALVGAIRVLTSTQTYRLVVGHGLVVGRDPDCDVVIGDPLASRHHLHILAGRDEVVLRDLKSRNGVFVNGVRIEQSVRLSSGDRVLLGTTELSVFSDDPFDQAIKNDELRPSFTPVSVERPALDVLRDDQGSVSSGWVSKYVYYARFIDGLSKELGMAHLARLKEALTRVPLLAYFADASALSRYDLAARSSFMRLILENRRQFSSVVMLSWSASVTAATEAFAAAMDGTATVVRDAAEFDRLLVQAAPLAQQRIAPRRSVRA